MAVLIAILCVSLLATLTEDLKQRAVRWPWLAGLMVAACVFSHIYFDHEPDYRYWLSNLSFLLLQWTVIVAFVSIKNRKWTNPLRGYLGAGDLAFMLALIPAFSPLNYMAFIIAANVMSLLLHYAAGLLFRKYDQASVPLAGFMSLALLVWLGASIFLQVSWLDDSYILGVILT